MQILFQDVRDAISHKRLNRHYRLPLVVPIIIHHGTKAFTGATQLRRLFPAISGFTQYLFSFHAILFDLNKVEYADLPDDPNEWRLNIVLKVMKLVFQEDNNQGVEDCFVRLLPHLHDDNLEHVEFTKLTIRYFLNASHTDPAWFINMVSEHYPEEDEGVKDMLTMREQLIEMGRQEGWQKGQQVGQQVGQVKSIIHVLSTRFGDVPSSVKKRLQAIRDEVVLDSILVSATLSKNMREFRESL